LAGETRSIYEKQALSRHRDTYTFKYHLLVMRSVRLAARLPARAAVTQLAKAKRADRSADLTDPRGNFRASRCSRHESTSIDLRRSASCRKTRVAATVPLTGVDGLAPLSDSARERLARCGYALRTLP
jgi:hypothetical protein